MRKMKDSGIEWIGTIPITWCVGRIKNIIALLTDYTANGSFGDLAKNVTYLDYEDYARLVRLTDLRENLNNMGVYVDKYGYNYLSKSSLYGGEILVANVGAYAGLFCEMPKVSFPATLAPNMFLIRTNDKMIQHYLYYLGNGSFVCEQLSQKAISSAQPKLNKNDIKTVYIPIPPLPEQQKIAAYLDKKCSEIDSLTADIQKQIETLEEYKRSVITEAVTKGLNPDVEMKDSGVEWVGEIPKNWTTIKAKYLIQINNGSDPISEGETPVYGSGNSSFKSCGEYKNPPAVLLGRKGTINNPRFITTRYWNVDTAFDAKEKDSRLCLKYYYYCAVVFDYDYYMSQTTLPSMTQTNYGNMSIPFPVLSVQKAIINYLDEKCAKIDCIVSTKAKQLETLAEYKKSLIYEYVTGKKEVNA